MEDKVLGKLIVIQSDDPKCRGSHLAFHGTDDKDVPRFVLRYCPKAKEATGVDARDARNIIAHELGHFLGNILHLPAQAKLNEAINENPFRFQFDKEFNRLTRIPLEREAWDIAEVIAPGSSTSPTAQYALKSYETSE